MKNNRVFRVFLGLIVAGGLLLYNRVTRAPLPAAESGPSRGGSLVATFRSEPAGYNRLVSATAGDGLFALLTQSTLIRVNKVTGEREPRLAREWTGSPDGLAWTLKLREGVLFSDGAPFSAADVLFTFEALYDPKVASGMASDFKVNGKPFSVRALDDYTVVLTFPSPFGPGLDVLDDLPILPKHTLESALKAGTFAKAWTMTTPPSEVVGLGPFVLTEYVAGQHLKFARNPHYWKQDEHGQPLPYLDALEVRIVPQQDAEVLQLESGDADLSNGQIRAEDIAAMKRFEADGKLKVADVGSSTDPGMLWFNLTAGATRVKDRPWLQREELRRAISYGVDRQAIVNTVYLGAAEPLYGPITAGYGEWYVPDLPKTEHDVAKAKDLLASIGLTDRNHDGLLDDAAGNPARFSILTQKGNTALERTVSMLQEQLRQVGLTVDVVAVDQGSLIQQWGKADYDAIYFYVKASATDPARNLEIWLSSGSFHFWNPEQVKPATAWETTVDDLMRKQSATMDRAERRRLFADVQRLYAEHLPLIYFAVPKVMIAMSARVRGATPSVVQPPVLWNAEALSVVAGGKVPPK